jgi:hypothetical protein
MAFQTFTKDPNATLDYVWDWSKWLTPLSDTISAVTFTAETGLTVGTTSHTGTTATVWLSGGTADTSYNVVCHITTTGGRTNDRTATVKIAEQ